MAARSSSSYSGVRPTGDKFISRVPTYTGLETKNLDLVSSTVIATSSFSIHLNPLELGTGPDERIGRQVRNVSFEVRANFKSAPGAGPMNVMTPYRILIVMDRQANGAPPVLAEILQETLTAGDAFVSPYNMATRKRFMILADDLTSPVGFPAFDGQIFPATTYHKYIPLKSTTIYDGAANDPTTNSLYMFVLAPTALAGPTLLANFRLCYTDA